MSASAFKPRLALAKAGPVYLKFYQDKFNPNVMHLVVGHCTKWMQYKQRIVIHIFSFLLVWLGKRAWVMAYLFFERKSVDLPAYDSWLAFNGCCRSPFIVIQCVHSNVIEASSLCWCTAGQLSWMCTSGLNFGWTIRPRAWTVTTYCCAYHRAVT